mmetsp:Transcript_6644/g.18619  ORF Transcript_6644/g.18619 Transcript_6644/m.18619 type:complete len:350 (+) Transcript_6644:415-1464(+)
MGSGMGCSVFTRCSSMPSRSPSSNTISRTREAPEPLAPTTVPPHHRWIPGSASNRAHTRGVASFSDSSAESGQERTFELVSSRAGTDSDTVSGVVAPLVRCCVASGTAGGASSRGLWPEARKLSSYLRVQSTRIGRFSVSPRVFQNSSDAAASFSSQNWNQGPGFEVFRGGSCGRLGGSGGRAMVDTRSIPRRPIVSDAASAASPSDREIHAVAAADGVSSGFAVCATMRSTVALIEGSTGGRASRKSTDVCAASRGASLADGGVGVGESEEATSSSDAASARVTAGAVAFLFLIIAHRCSAADAVRRVPIAAAITSHLDGVLLCSAWRRRSSASSPGVHLGGRFFFGG